MSDCPLCDLGIPLKVKDEVSVRAFYEGKWAYITMSRNAYYEIVEKTKPMLTPEQQLEYRSMVDCTPDTNFNHPLQVWLDVGWVRSEYSWVDCSLIADQFRVYIPETNSSLPFFSGLKLRNKPL